MKEFINNPNNDNLPTNAFIQKIQASAKWDIGKVIQDKKGNVIDFLPPGTKSGKRPIKNKVLYDHKGNVIPTVSERTKNIKADLQKLLGSWYMMNTANKDHSADFERIQINKTPGEKEIDIALVGEKMNIIVTPRDADYCYTWSFDMEDMGKMTAIIDKFFTRGGCAEWDLMKKEWHTKAKHFDMNIKEYLPVAA